LVVPQTNVFAFSDDTNIVCRPEHVHACCSIIIECFDAIKIKLATDKCTILCQGIGDVERAAQCPFPIVDVSDPNAGRVLMGNPIGGLTYRKETLLLMAKKHTKSIDVLSELRANSAFVILKQCVNPKFVYTTRINHPFVAGDALKVFDDKVDYGLFNICCSRRVSDTHLDKTILNNISVIRSLPLHLGGLGMMAHGGLVGNKGFIVSQNVMKTYLTATGLPSLLHVLNTTNPPIWLGYKNNTPPPPGLSAGAMNSDDLLDMKRTLNLIRNRVSKDFHFSLLQEDESGQIRAQEAALYASNIYDGSGKAFSCQPGVTTCFQSAIFKEMLRLRLLVNPILDLVIGRESVRCSCGKVLSTYQDGFHLLRCSLLQPQRTKRHTQTKNHIRKYLFDRLPEDCSIIVEPRTLVGGSARAGDLMISDSKLNFQRVIDIVISDPTSISNLAQRSFDNPNAVTEAAEAMKLESYKDTDWLRRGIFYPFAMTSTGKLGAKGVEVLEFIKLKYELNDSFITELCAELAQLCQLALATMVVTARIALRFPPELAVYSAASDTMEVG
jgi:hypothetical protein